MLYLLFFLFREPVTLSSGQLRFQLGEQLRMIGRCAVNLAVHFRTKETAASCGISQQVRHIGRTDERGDTGQMTECRTMCPAESQCGRLHQILQGRHLPGTVLVELIHIDQSEKRKFLFTSTLARQVELIYIIRCKFLGHQNLAKRRLALPLLTTHQHRRHRIGAILRLPQPLGGNTQHPTVKPFHPHRLTRYTHSQRSNTIHPVPLRQVAHIMQKRMIVFHLSGMEQTAHILIPAVDATGTRLQAECIQITLSHHGILFIRHLFPTILRLFGEKVITEIIPCSQKALQGLQHILRFLAPRFAKSRLFIDSFCHASCFDSRWENNFIHRFRSR